MSNLQLNPGKKLQIITLFARELMIMLNMSGDKKHKASRKVNQFSDRFVQSSKHSETTNFYLKLRLKMGRLHFLFTQTAHFVGFLKKTNSTSSYNINLIKITIHF